MFRISYSLIMALLVLLSTLTCQEQVEIGNISKAPEIGPEEKHFANVFKPLDGVWRGEFYIYRDQRGQTQERSQPTDLDSTLFQKLPLKLENKIRVEQTYVSKSPYFQEVRIKDMYVDESGQKQTVESYGVNKVQNGQLWCVVKKPNEKVIHRGRLEGEHTIVWQRNVCNPLRIEYFKETVKSEEYTIIGWGYYGKDDPELSPGFWFRGRYEREGSVRNQKSK
ncbi:hypothetical protein GWO43_04440 [candidate division KSB1 bacterium]|nr:hypothetical protein [candidate division KSB1 bacterium]NIR71106.1 hypothetical protein [candidate division KSB1 bacterium]NIS23266.1 hypothetical protein [candidate division KSB1 bacterium]NIT70146.1 hypothetical protein [candidate division KSB1 bacterium]NIU23796.1 hypothetical protein [candidate division KSB1 bacterium]